MSIWAEIKKALNSTLGTSHYKPLDELFFRTKTLIPSDQIFYQFPQEIDNLYASQDYEFSKKIRFYNGGTVNFETYMVGSAPGGNINGKCVLVVYKNGIEFARANWTSDARIAMVSVNVNPYDVFSLKLENQSTNGTFASINSYIRAEITEAAFEVIE